MALATPTLFAQWFEDNAGETVSVGLSNGFAVTAVCDGANADGSAVFLLTGPNRDNQRLFATAHIISVGIERD